MKGRPAVVIVGAGFGGLSLARSLADAPVDIRLIDRRNYHTFQPLLYQVATGFLESNSIANNVRAIFRSQQNVSFTMGDVHGVDLVNRRVTLRTAGVGEAESAYDVLVLAPGVDTDFLSVSGAQRAFTLKSLEDAIRLRNQILRQFEIVDAGVADPTSGALTFVIVGGGSTGVELAGAMSDLFRRTLARQFHGRIVKNAKIVLVEALPRLLAALHESSSNYAERLLASRGVDVRLGARVDKVDDHGLTLNKGETVSAHTVIWVAGVKGTPLMTKVAGGRLPGGRLVVGTDLALRGRPDVFVIGDAAAAWGRDSRPYPQVAPVAVQEGRYVAQVIRRRLRGLATEDFVYADRGSMSTVGRNAAVAELPGGLRFSGGMAWSIWLGLHLIELIGFRNKSNVLLDWAWNYATHHQGAGLMQCEAMQYPTG